MPSYSYLHHDHQNWRDNAGYKEHPVSPLKRIFFKKLYLPGNWASPNIKPVGAHFTVIFGSKSSAHGQIEEIVKE